MYIISTAYFTKEYFVPNLDEMDSKISADLDLCIDQYARELLRFALGFKLWRELDIHIQGGVLDAGAPQKWLDLVNGVTYTKNAKEYRWRGLIYTDGAHEGSLITPFVYYQYLLQNVSILTGTGEKVIEATNASNVNSTQRLNNAWNDFVYQYQGYNRHDYMPSMYYYNDAYVVDYYGRRNVDTQEVSLLEFIQDFKADYPNPASTVFTIVNQLGL